MALSQEETEALRKSLVECNLPLEERWRRAGEASPPRDEWHSFDRTPWNHPWMKPENIRHFADFSAAKLSELGALLGANGGRDKSQQRSWLRGKVDRLIGGSREVGQRFAFVGNMANVNYIRARPLRQRNVPVDLVLHPHDDFIFAQPGWEEFDGEVTDLGADPKKALLEKALPSWVHRHQSEPNWEHIPFQLDKFAATPAQILLWPEYMQYFPTLAALSCYDALLVSQFPYLGYFSGRPYLFGQIGGDIWFEASRNDSFGILTRRAIAASAAVLVSNPITLAHARRYGLSNVLYVPWPLSEDDYSPGDADDIRADWRQQIGGEFFVFTSMRMDRHWKGAEHALEGFARFASRAPSARLVVLGWGEDIEFARSRMTQLGLQDRVLFLPTVGKRRLVRYLRAADLVIEQFVLGYYGASALEAMACGKPVIMRIEREQYDALIDVGAPPVLDAESGTDVERHLYSLYEDRAKCRKAGEQAREWFIRAQSSERWAKTYTVLLEALAAGIPLSFSGSPLLEPLSADEQRYHASQLSSAPPFPNYVDP
ncbi:glycosyltransferase [Bradyrhizobium sp. 41S5]|uniref:glycosyltransferase n=1 Tax=Bradyrhizobium sp. 41S5 TaxID=1404443 RepID=UPI00156A76D9|nr:glycosyltransferase [Bradyrhizobium sp. 41S5]UFX47769.1 glycosyltransferase [Bradyrhizobium sp. 41S5]